MAAHVLMMIIDAPGGTVKPFIRSTFAGKAVNEFRSEFNGLCWL
jgi:hypothetical protein